MNKILTWTSAVCLGFALSAPLFAALPALALDQVELPVAEGPAFEVVLETGSRMVTLEEIEALGLYRITTTSPWEPDTYRFEGPMLKDVLTHLGLADAPAIVLTAIDGFTATIPQMDWAEGHAMLATRLNGKPMSLRMQGPTRIVYPEIDFPKYADPIYKPRWIWLISKIEAASQ